MQPSTNFMLRLLLGLAVLTLGCQSLLDVELPSFFGSESEPSWPHSTFVPPTKRTQILQGQPVELETYHLSPNKLTQIEIAVNGQPLRSEETAGAAAFPAGLLNVQVRRDDGGLIQTARVTPVLSATTQTVSLVIVGTTPGSYDLSLVAVDEAGQKGEAVTQRIEVVEPSR
ncbi:MAG TPA: hypothetical protein P5526_09960 [Anaerolineae bacterium]|nr:hypothetical protein [Anaerolineae bacterium]MCB0222641.1 hypothetical protein [Anaerolineae bacterium]MCB9105285.1 hypothetical protein [Anaerolineales bacterium]HRV92473.1 hypothetical protein [Anaerolineae bacterium]